MFSSQCTISSDSGEPLSLLFAGQECGHISLLHGARVTMPHPSPAHAGHVIKLSSATNQIPSPSPTSSSSPLPALVSYGSDERLNVWGLEIDVHSCISLKLLATVAMDTCPAHMLILHSSLCLALNSNRVVCLAISGDSPRLSGSVQRLAKMPGLLAHQWEDDHTDTVTSLTACPFLDLFVTTSHDGRAKIWSYANQLVSELSLGPSLTAACFGTSRGDLLVGFQEHISIVCAEDFLPSEYLEAAERTKCRDYTEEPIPFDPDLRFW